VKPESGTNRILTGSRGPAPSSHQIWRPWFYAWARLRCVRFVLLTVMTLLVLGLVIAVGTPETRPLEKAAAALAILAVVAVAGPVRRIRSAT